MEQLDHEERADFGLGPWLAAAEGQERPGGE
jgi:hypothetical protein